VFNAHSWSSLGAFYEIDLERKFCHLRQFDLITIRLGIGFYILAVFHLFDHKVLSYLIASYIDGVIHHVRLLGNHAHAASFLRFTLRFVIDDCNHLLAEIKEARKRKME
jgi:hypothetical protein